jgi:hypothetical protein
MLNCGESQGRSEKSMFNAGYVVSIVSGGHVIEESRQDVVRLPFDSEYAIRLRNRSKRDAVAQIFIDGENVSKDGFIVRAGQFVDIECHVETLRNFRFVSADSYAAAVAGKSRQPDDRNGVVEVRWRAEKEARPVPTLNMPIYKGRRLDPNDPSWFEKGGPRLDNTRKDGHETTCDFEAQEQPVKTSGGLLRSMNCADRGDVVKGITPQRSTEGCTVQGTHSDQRFRVGTIGELVPHDQAVVCRLFLKAPDLPVVGTTSKTFCTECGRPPLPADRFCGSCGNPLYQ